MSDETKFEGLRETYSEILRYYPLTAKAFSQGINEFSSLFNREKKLGDYAICGRTGKVGIKLDEFSCLDIPYFGVENDCDDKEKHSENFYCGEVPLSWYGAKNDFAINRVSQYRCICQEISALLKDGLSKVVYLLHAPGAGGTTLSRNIAFNMSKIVPVALLKLYNEKLTPIQIFNLYRKTDMPILLIAEKTIINDEDLQKLIKELMANAVPYIVLRVCRTSIKKLSDKDLCDLYDCEIDEMKDKLMPFVASGKEQIIDEVKTKRLDERYPFFISMYVFEEKFKGVVDYVRHFLKNITDSDFHKLLFISLIDKYANKSLDISFLRSISADFTELFDNDINLNLVCCENKGHNRFVKMRHVRFADELIEAYIAEHSDDDFAKAKKLSELIREFIVYSKQNIMYDLDSTIDVLKNLLIMRDTNSLGTERFAPIIEDIRKRIPSDLDDNEKFNCIGLIFKELVKVYPEEAHFKAHLSRFYSYIERNFDKGMSEAEKAVEIAEEQGANDALLYHIYGMSIKKYIEQRLYKEASACYVNNEKKLFDEEMKKIQEYLLMAGTQFKKIRETNNKVAGYISDIEMCIYIIDFCKKLYGIDTEEFLISYRDSWMMEYYDRALTLMEGFRSIQVEEETEFYKVKLSAKCNESLRVMINSIESTIGLWEEYLQHASDLEKPVVRRFIARAKEKGLSKENDVRRQNAKKILELMEENIRQEPSNGANIRIWFNALRYVDNETPDIALDEALQKLASWKQIGDNFESYYYYFILICIKAIEGSSRAEAMIADLQQELKEKTSHMPNNRVIYEWLGKGKGITRLINAREWNNGEYKKRNIEYIEQHAHILEGRISKYKNERSAQIRAYSMNVFFSPVGQIEQISVEDINKKAEFIMGFTYDGVRALNKSVRLISGKRVESEDDKLIGKTVKCVVQCRKGHSFLVVSLADERNKIGSIHSSELPNDKTVNDYDKGDQVWGKILDKKYIERDGRSYYQISMKPEDQETDRWRQQLIEYGKTL